MGGKGRRREDIKKEKTERNQPTPSGLKFAYR